MRLSEVLGSLKHLAGATTKPDIGIESASGINYLKLASADGTEYWIFPENDGTLKIHTAEPTANTDGSEVGGQS